MREKLTVETDRHIAYLTIYSSSNDEDDQMEEGGNCSTFDSGTGDSAKNNSSKKIRRDKKLKEEKTKIGDDGGKGGGRINGEEKEEDQIDGKILTKNVLLNEESSLTQQKYNLIEETSGYISMLQIQNNNFEPKPGPSQQQQQIFEEPKNHLSSPISAKNKQKLSKKEENVVNNFSSKNSPLPPLPKNLTEFSEKIDNQHHHLPFLRRRNFNNGSNGRGKENNNNNKLQHKPSQIANRTSVKNFF
ncbi:unnamed protein product [Meloidogyne enterolobii]|uniref:Uncharacterized protein n=1 Tax=Meloidogyne enterolobii TaxID=390850 RepID=A0ACB1B3W3_MELEN